MRGAHSVGKTQAIRFGQRVFLRAIHRPLFRVWGGYREPIRLVKHGRFVLWSGCFSGGSEARFPCVGWLPGAYSVVKVQGIRFVVGV